MTTLKSMTRLTFSVLALLAASENANGAPPREIPIEFQAGYFPAGFDSNDQVQFVTVGQFRDSCHKAAPPQVDVDLSARRIYVQGRALRYEGPCLDVLVPFYQTIDVGLLPPGEFMILSGSSRKPLGRLSIREAPSAAPDDYLYAPVSQALHRFTNQGRNVVVLSGEFSSPCARFREARVSVQGSVVSVQPITELIEAPSCRGGGGRFPFERIVELPRVRPGRYLLHVRSLNATALNSLITVR